MTVIPFVRPAKPNCVHQTIDATALAWIPLSQLREILWTWDGVDPTFARRVTQAAAQMLIETTDTDAQAQTRGWRDAEACRKRGLDMLAVLNEKTPDAS